MAAKTRRWKYHQLQWGILLCLGLGCGARTDGPSRYELSGAVTFDGQPVPSGIIRFIADVDKGNRGPGTVAVIQGGQYQTRTGKGTVGGSMIVEIVGYDGAAVQRDGEMSETPLFEQYRTSVDLPNKKFRQDFDVPLSAGKTKRP